MEHPKGEPQNPQTDAEHEEKFWKCGRYANYSDTVLTKVRDLIMDLENIKDITGLTEFLG